MSDTTQVAGISLEEVLKQFNKQGYVILKGVLSPDVMQKVRAEVNRLIDRQAEKLIAEGKIDHAFEDEPFDKRLYQMYQGHLDGTVIDFREELHLPGMFYLFFNPTVLDVVEAIIGEEFRIYPNYQLRPKFPDHAGSLVLWHQDGGYTARLDSTEQDAVQTLRMVNVWAPLVSARVENGCMQFVPQTHTLGVVPHIDRGLYLEIAPEVLDSRLDQAVPIELEPGDVVLFHNLLFHAGLPNTVDTIRWSVDWRYQDATQPTLRKENGHIARSASDPDSEIKSAKQWGELKFG